VAAGEYIRILSEGKEIFNIDESLIRSSDSRRRGWVLAKNRILVSKALRLPQLSIIGTVSSKGRTFFTVNQGKNTSTTFTYYLMKLSEALDASDPGWRARSVFLLDNASIHRSVDSVARQEDLGLKIMFLAPYSFKMAAVERLFSFMKNRDLNPLAVTAYSR
jgi:hypothetical protein